MRTGYAATWVLGSIYVADHFELWSTEEQARAVRVGFVRNDQIVAMMRARRLARGRK